MREASIALISELEKAYESICIIPSPSSAPKARLNMNLITLLKMLSLQNFLARTKKIAAINPINEIPIPVKIPNPQT
jgi:hypothetical protein